MLPFLILGRLEILKVNSERRSVSLISQKKTGLRNKQLLALTLTINSTGRQSNTRAVSEHLQSSESRWLKVTFGNK